MIETTKTTSGMFIGSDSDALNTDIVHIDQMNMREELLHMDLKDIIGMDFDNIPDMDIPEDSDTWILTSIENEIHHAFAEDSSVNYDSKIAASPVNLQTYTENKYIDAGILVRIGMQLMDKNLLQLIKNWTNTILSKSMYFACLLISAYLPENTTNMAMSYSLARNIDYTYMSEYPIVGTREVETILYNPKLNRSLFLSMIRKRMPNKFTLPKPLAKVLGDFELENQFYKNQRLQRLKLETGFSCTPTFYESITSINFIDSPEHEKNSLLYSLITCQSMTENDIGIILKRDPDQPGKLAWMRLMYIDVDEKPPIETILKDCCYIEHNCHISQGTTDVALLPNQFKIPLEGENEQTIKSIIKIAQKYFKSVKIDTSGAKYISFILVQPSYNVNYRSIDKWPHERNMDQEIYVASLINSTGDMIETTPITDKTDVRKLKRILSNF